MKITLLLCVAALITGCATQATPLREAKDVPPQRVFFNYPASDKTATAIFMRDVGFLGSGVYQHLSIDGQKAASLNPGEKVSFNLEAGEHIFGVIPTNVFGEHAVSSIDQDLKPGRTYHYRIQTDGGSFRTEVRRIPAPTE